MLASSAQLGSVWFELPAIMQILVDRRSASFAVFALFGRHSYIIIKNGK